MYMKEVNIKCKVYPKDLDFEKITRILDHFGIEIEFMFSEGINVIYPEDTLEHKITPGIISFYDTKQKSRVLTISDNFGSLDFYGPGEYSEESLILTIPTI